MEVDLSAKGATRITIASVLPSYSALRGAGAAVQNPTACKLQWTLESFVVRSLGSLVGALILWWKGYPRLRLHGA